MTNETEAIRKTLIRSAQLRFAGYTITFIWSCHFNKLKATPEFEYFKNNKLKADLARVNPVKDQLNEEEIVQYIKEGLITGLVKCNLQLPEHRFKDCLELSPIFTHRETDLHLMRKGLDSRLKQFYPMMDEQDDCTYVANYGLKYGKNTTFVI